MQSIQPGVCVSPQLAGMSDSAKFVFGKMHDDDGNLREFVIEIKLDGAGYSRILTLLHTCRLLNSSTHPCMPHQRLVYLLCAHCWRPPFVSHQVLTRPCCLRPLQASASRCTAVRMPMTPFRIFHVEPLSMVKGQTTGK